MTKFVKFVYFLCNLFDKKLKNGVEILRQTEKTPSKGCFFRLAQRRGFEPPDTFLHHTISNRAP